MNKYLVIIIWMIFSNCYGQEPIIIALSAAPNNLNPFYSTDANSQNINRLIHLSLIDFDEQMKPVCVACESYHTKMIGLKQSISFKLKSNLTFIDGTQLTAFDVKNSWELFAKNKSINSVFMGEFENIENIQTKNELEFEIIYFSFREINLLNLATLKILKKTKNESYIGAGLYELAKEAPLEIILKPRNNKKPNLIFKVVKDETTLALKLINKEVDISVASMSPRKVLWLKNKTGIQVWEKPSGNFVFMAINHKLLKFKNIKIRKALSLLIPRQEILKYKLKGTAVLASGMFSPSFGGLYEKTEIDSYNPTEAKKLLESEGYGKKGKILELDWKISNNKASIEIAEIIKDYFEKAGIIVNLSIQEWGTYMNSYKGGRFDILIGQWIGFTGPDMLNFVYHSDNIPPKGGNRFHYNNKEIDNLLDKAKTTVDTVQRYKLYKKAQILISKDYASINLWHPNITWIGSRCLKNVNVEPTGSFSSMPYIEKICDK